MKIILLVLIVAGVVLWMRQRDIEQKEKARVEAALVESRAAEQTKVTPPPVRPAVNSLAPPDRQRGGGTNSSASSTPAPGSKGVRDGFGWKNAGPLDPKPKR